jgi:hypothetical protein
MKASRFAAASLVLVLALSLFAGFAQSAPAQKEEPKKPEPKQPPKEILPKEIKAIIQEGLATRQGRHDIPFTIFRSLYLWVPGGSMYTVVFFKAKNADLGYGVPAAPAPAPKGKPAPAAGPANVLETRLTVALEFFQADEKGTLKVVRDDGFSSVLQTESAGYDPNKEEWYSMWHALPYGKYTMAMLLAPLDPKKHAPDLKKVGVGYVDLTLPGPEATQNSIDTTSIIFTKSVEEITQPDKRPALHQGYFTYGRLKIAPILDNVLTADSNLQAELFFFVLGAKTKPAPAGEAQAASQPIYDLEINYQVQKEDGSTIIRWNPQSYESFSVYQPLPLKRTLAIKDEKGNERREEKQIDPGKYSLVLQITDKVSGLKAEKKVPFEVK